MTNVNPLHHTMVADTVWTATFERAYPRVEVLIWDNPGTDEVWFRTDGGTPVIGADGTHVMPAVIGAVEVDSVNHAVVTDGPKVTSVKVITAGTPKVTVRGLP